LTQAPANSNRPVLFPAELKFIRLRNFDKKSIVRILVRFLLAEQLMLQIKFNFNNFTPVCHSLAACQRHTPSLLAAVIGLSSNDVISLRSLRCVRHFVNSLRALRWLETPLYINTS